MKRDRQSRLSRQRACPFSYATAWPRFLLGRWSFHGNSGTRKVVDSLFRLPSNTRRWPSEIAKCSRRDSCGVDTSGRERVCFVRCHHFVRPGASERGVGDGIGVCLAGQNNSIARKQEVAAMLLPLADRLHRDGD